MHPEVPGIVGKSKGREVGCSWSGFALLNSVVREVFMVGCHVNGDPQEVRE